MGSFHKNIQLMLVLIKSSLLVQHFSWYILMTFLLILPVILQSILWYYSTHLKTTLYNLWQQTELASEVESDSRDFVDLNRKWLVDFNAGKTLLVLFERSNKTGAFDVEIDWSFHEGKSSFKMLGCLFLLNWIEVLYIISIAHTASEKIGALIRSMKFLILLCISLNLPCNLALNTIVISGLVLRAATWNS